MVVCPRTPTPDPEIPTSTPTPNSARTLWRWPSIAAALPSHARFRLLSRVAASDRVVLPDEAAAWAQAVRFGYARLPESGTSPVAETTWRRAWRLVQLVDHTDLFVATTRGAGWFERDADIAGAWPEAGPAAGPFLAVTYHWGAGLGSLAHLARAGLRAHFLSIRIRDEDFAADPWRLRYMKLRIRATERAAGAPVIYTGEASAHIVAAFAAGENVVALCDVPAAPGRSAIATTVGAMRLTMPLGLIRLACERRVPVVTFAAGLDRTTGRRHLAIDEARTFADPAALAAALAARFESLLARDPAAWHQWPYAHALFQSTYAITNTPFPAASC